MAGMTHAQMIREAVEALGTAKPRQIMDHIKQKYPNVVVNESSFRADIIGCTVNHTSAKHYPGMPRFLYFHAQDKTYSINGQSSFGHKTRGAQSSTYNTNLAAEFYVLSTLYRLGINAYLTLGNKKSVDIVVDKAEHDIVTIDVKGLVGRYDWPADNVIETDNRHYYVLVTYENRISDPLFCPSSWIIPATKISKFTKIYKTRKVVSRSMVLKDGMAYKEDWGVFN
ncbi:MAG: hypothetical protein WB392_12475 [Methanotrichaceae archaeon]